MKIKGFALACGIMWAIIAIWVTLVHLWGFGAAPFDVIDHFYLGLMMPSYPGIILNAVLFFLDGLVFGAIFAWLYNKLS